MANVSFKRGLRENLPAVLTDGAFYITTDERAIYLDVDNETRIRIGDFQEFATLAALQANTNPSATALYYVTELNCLAKWDGTKYVQINLDTGATSVETTGTGNALDGVSYDPATRKLTFTKTTAFTTASDVDSKIAAKVGELKIGEESYATVKAYVDEKTSGIATDVALEDLSDRVAAAEGEIDRLNGDVSTDGSVDKKIADAIGETVGDLPADKTVWQAIEDAKTAATYDDTVLAGKVDTLIGTDTGKSARTIANEELAKQLIPESAKESLDTLAEIAAWIQSHPDDASAMSQAIDDLENLVGTLPTDASSATVVGYIKEYVDGAITALNIGDYAKASDLTDLTARVASLEADTHTHANADELDKIVAGDKAKWDAAEQNAKDYTDAALSWGVF